MIANRHAYRLLFPGAFSNRPKLLSVARRVLAILAGPYFTTSSGRNGRQECLPHRPSRRAAFLEAGHIHPTCPRVDRHRPGAIFKTSPGRRHWQARKGTAGLSPLCAPGPIISICPGRRHPLGAAPATAGPLVCARPGSKYLDTAAAVTSSGYWAQRRLRSLCPVTGNGGGRLRHTLRMG